jgi:prevent-host-death family protein
MTRTYSTYEAKARFSELLRWVRGGERVVVTYRGEEVAEISPLEREPSELERLQRLRADGILGPPAERRGQLKPIARKPGGLKRFLESRD